MYLLSRGCDRLSKYKKIREITLKRGRHFIRGRIQLFDSPDAKPTIQLWRSGPKQSGRYNENFTITSLINWEAIKNGIEDDLLKHIGWMNQTLSKSHEKQIIAQEIQRLTQNNARLKNIVNGYDRILAEYRINELPQYQEHIAEFKKLLAQKNKEDRLQSFLKRHAWMLGLEFINPESQKLAGKSRFDFYLERYDGFHDLIELKRADVELFNKKGKMSSTVAGALQQAIEYIDKIDRYSDSKSLTQEFNLGKVSRPKATVVIGRSNKIIEEKLRRLNHYFVDIEIITYDYILNKAQSTINFFKQIKKKRK